MTADSNPTTLSPVADQQWAEALLLLLREYPPATRSQQAAGLMVAARKGDTSFDSLLVAKDEKQITAAVWTNALPGRLGALWSPQFRDDSRSQPELARELILAAEKVIQQTEEIALWQTSIELNASHSQDYLECAGYQPLAVLSQMTATIAPAEESPVAAPFRLVRYQPTDFARLCDTIEATYIDTLDCPELDAFRSTSDCLTGYRHIGMGGEQHWYFVQHAERVVGCLLLAQHEATQFELVYMGLASECRGKGWGKLLTAQAFQVARSEGGLDLITSVDERNHPAIRAYKQAGFRTWQRREVWVKPVV